MPRPRQSTGLQLTPGQASWVLERLISERRISAGEVVRYVSEMQNEISDLERRLQRLKEASGASSTAGSAAEAPARRGRRPGRPAGRPAGRPGRPPGSGRKAGAEAAANANEAAAAKGGRKGRKRSAITAEQLASRQLQGRYLALVRQFPENRRGNYAKIAKERGREAAIRDMQDALKK